MTRNHRCNRRTTQGPSVSISKIKTISIKGQEILCVCYHEDPSFDLARTKNTLKPSPYKRIRVDWYKAEELGITAHDSFNTGFLKR